jgi:hypothetical protein
MEDNGSFWNLPQALLRDRKILPMQMIWIEILVRGGFVRLIDLMGRLVCLQLSIVGGREVSFIPWHGVLGRRE